MNISSPGSLAAMASLRVVASCVLSAQCTSTIPGAGAAVLAPSGTVDAA